MKVNTGNLNGEGKDSSTRTEETRLYDYSYARFHRGVGGQGESAGYQQERINRADDALSPALIYPRAGAPGKILDQLIDKSYKQLALRESEILEIRSHIEELELLRGQLMKPETE